jgi:tRNA-specific 2-thiouridylase
MASVLLGFSGGIDSTTAAQRLKDEGYNVVALTIDTMLNDDAIERAKLRAAEVGVEWYLYDARERFERDIIEYFCEEYASGRTPAPCTRCNTLIKWQILLEEYLPFDKCVASCTWSRSAPRSILLAEILYNISLKALTGII